MVFRPSVASDGITAFDKINFTSDGSHARSVVVAESGLMLNYVDSGISMQAVLQPAVPSLAFTGDLSISGIRNSTTGRDLLVGFKSAQLNNATFLKAFGDESTAERPPQVADPGLNFLALAEADGKYVQNDQALDIDGDGQISPFTDGTLLIRYMPPDHLRGDDLIRGRSIQTASVRPPMRSKPIFRLCQLPTVPIVASTVWTSTEEA